MVREPHFPPFSYLSIQNADSWAFDSGERRMALLLELLYKERRAIFIPFILLSHLKKFLSISSLHEKIRVGILAGDRNKNGYLGK